jgi:hypothetical protein
MRHDTKFDLECSTPSKIEAVRNKKGGLMAALFFGPENEGLLETRFLALTQLVIAAIRFIDSYTD